jgi:aryl-alcohol dehydrogenase-like predicted oxidoreductase
VSNFDARRLRAAHAELARDGIALASNQVQYSLLHRRPEVDGVLEACRELGVLCIAYMPLASGALTGKYDASHRPGGIRRVLPSFRRSNLNALTPVIDLLSAIGAGHDAGPPQVALRWLIQRGAVPIPGAKNAAQTRANVGALRIVLDPAEIDALDATTRRWRR